MVEGVGVDPHRSEWISASGCFALDEDNENDNLWLLANWKAEQTWLVLLLE